MSMYFGIPSGMAASIGYVLGVSFPLPVSPLATIKCEAADCESEMCLGPLLSPQIYHTSRKGSPERVTERCDWHWEKGIFFQDMPQLQIPWASQALSVPYPTNSS